MRSFWDRQPAALKYVAPRLAAFVLGWIALTIATFTLLFVAHDPVDRHLNRGASQQERDEVRHALGMDHPAYRIYWNWLSDFARGDLGTDTLRHRSISAEVRHKAQPTVELLLVSVAIGTAAGYGLNELRRRRAWARRTSLVVTSIAGALPVVVLATFVLVIPANYWGYAPSLGGFIRLSDNPWGNIREIAPAALLLTLAVAAFVALDLDRWRDYGRWRAVAFSALRATPLAISAAVIAEQTFNFAGLALYLLEATKYGDDFLVQSLLAIFGALALFVWLLPPRPPESHEQRATSIAWGDWIRSPLAIAALALIGAFIFFGVVGPWIAPYGPFDYRAGLPQQTPSTAHLLGTDRLGRDELSRILYGARAELKLLAAVIGLGFVPGMLAGFALRSRPQWSRRALDELRSLWWSLPWLVVLLALSTVYAPDLKAVAIVLGLGAFLSGVAWTTNTLPLAEGDSWGTRLHEIAPGALAQAASVAALVILADVTVAFLGFSVPRTSWGSDLGGSRTFPFPVGLMGMVAAVICGTLLAFNLLAASAVDHGEPQADVDASPENLPVRPGETYGNPAAGGVT